MQRLETPPEKVSELYNMGATGLRVDAQAAIPPSSLAPPANVLLPDDRVFVTVVHSVAIAITILRLARRIRIKLLSWDDYWAAFSAVLVAVFLVVDWVKWVSLEDKVLIMDAAEYKKKSMAMVSALMAISLGVIWCSRVSLALSIARILPPSRLRIMALGLSVACFAAMAITITVKLVVFNVPTLQTKPKVQRWIYGTFHVVGERNLVFGVLLGLILASNSNQCGVVSSIVLTAIPLYAFWNSTSLPPAERRLILVLFASGLLNLIACCVRTAFTIDGEDERGLSYSINLQIYCFIDGDRRRSMQLPSGDNDVVQINLLEEEDDH
ncbi:hypothetical protein PQX77_004567 [Marasmius sp. AFHP31]|nr:hypothetical protein PQX77_004567 [Marasmius sp. AFHP31]